MKIYKFQDLSTFQIAPIIDKKDKGVVHHMVIYVCKDSFNETHLNISGDCYYDRNMPKSIKECVPISPMYAWAVGGVVSNLFHSNIATMHHAKKRACNTFIIHFYIF